MSYHEKVLYHKVMVSVRPTRVRTNAASAMLSVGNRRVSILLSYYSKNVSVRVWSL